MPLVQTSPDAPTATPSVAADAQALWTEIVRGSLDACISRKEGREAQATGLLQDRLPPLIRQWSNASGLPAETCKENLRTLFRRIEESVEGCYRNRRLVVDEMCARLAAPSVPADLARRAATPALPEPAAASRAPAAALDASAVVPAAAPAPAEELPLPLTRSLPLERAVPPATAPSAEAGALLLRQRVALADVSGMLDAVVAAEHAIRTKSPQPVRRSHRAMTQLFASHAASSLILTA